MAEVHKSGKVAKGFDGCASPERNRRKVDNMIPPRHARVLTENGPPRAACIEEMIRFQDRRIVSDFIRVQFVPKAKEEEVAVDNVNKAEVAATGHRLQEHGAVIQT